MSNLVIKKAVRDYLNSFPEEKGLLKLCLDQLEQEPSITSRKNFVGHCTGASFVYCTSTKRVLLLEHKSLGKFLQPGGHIDKDESPYQAAVRELAEETGITEEVLTYRSLLLWSSLVPFDIDTHFIPENKKKAEPAHYHHDMRYLFLIDGEIDVVIDEKESKQSQWVEWGKFIEMAEFQKVARKMEQLTS